MPDDLGYPQDPQGAAEAMMKLGQVNPEEWLEKLGSMGFELKKTDDMGMSDDSDMGEMAEGDEEASEGEMEDAPPQESEEPEGAKEESSVSIVAMLPKRRKSAAGNALAKHGYK
jgi:hypothetical protein